MSQSFSSAEEFISSLPQDRQASLRQVRDFLLDHLPEGVEEAIQYNMLAYVIPKSIYPAGYHCNPGQPLPLFALGNGKNYMSLHLMFIYGDEAKNEAFRAAWAATRKKLDMGKACLRFKKPEDLAFDVLGAALDDVSVAGYIRAYESVLANSKTYGKKAPAKPV